MKYPVPGTDRSTPGIGTMCEFYIVLFKVRLCGPGNASRTGMSAAFPADDEPGKIKDCLPLCSQHEFFNTVAS